MTATHDRTRTGTTGTTAAYLRCYPYDRWNMDLHRRALEERARLLGLRPPRIYLDNGASSSACRPELGLLLGRASMGLIDTVLVPGSWVFSLDAATAHAVAEFLRATGAQVLELPERSLRTQHCLAS